MTVELQVAQGWLTVCELSSLIPGRGVAALLPDGSQAAVFLDRAGRPYAIGNQDPFTGAQVLSRGLVGTAGGRPFVASPCSSSASTWSRGAAWTTRRRRSGPTRCGPP